MLHRVPFSIISCHIGGPPFTSNFWKLLQKDLGNQKNLSKTFHLQMDGQEKCTIQTLEDMSRVFVIYFK